ncbi:APA family basic amino acid/polyamine antiporter [Lacibacter cauensis]|uniref:APA family basic amino acid/polyamine antiporter n=1 Tax=Lacibacter cauensis TaxID=510947 RepID=A0A562SPY3_9BACT|nr:amino acid permease [Lacibacter cauensis]TWI83084.1 APA family basic amino acid/polyamine antiporter [Lacibacter cauensis]
MHNNTSTQQPTLKRALGLSTGILLVAGMMIGSGVFKKIVPMAQTGLSETWIIVAWIGAGLITMFGAFTLAGLSALTEESGGVYEYLRLSFGNFFSFLFGWTDFTIIGCASIAALGFIFAQTVNVFIPLGNPFHTLEHVSIAGFIFPFQDGGIKMLAITAIILLTWVNYRGVQNGGLVNNIITSAKILGILLLIVLGLSYAGTNETIQPTTSAPATELHGMALFSAVLAAMLSAFWAYDGWSNISFIAGEIKNPKRNIPMAIISGVAIAMLLYVLINLAYMHVLPLHTLKAVEESQIGAAVVAETLLGKAGQSLIVVLIMISVFGTINGIILAHARIYYRMAQGNFFFKKAATVHPVYRTPSVTLLYTMIWSCVLVLSGTFDMLTNMVIFAGFLFYSLVVIALFKMKRNGTIKTKVIGYPVLPAFVGLFSIALLVNTVITQPVQSLTGLVLVLSGVFFYLYFKKQHSTG